MTNFKKINIRELEQNLVNLIGDDYTLITTKYDDKVNAMTASWGFFGVMWNKNVVNLVVRPSRYTYAFLKNNETFTLNFLNPGNEEILKFCGTKSGREYDKIKETGLNIIESDGVIAFSQSKLVIKCKKLYVQDMNKDSFIDSDLGDKMYPNDDIHTMFIAEIEDVFQSIR